MKMFIAWCKQEVDNGEMIVWIMLTIFVALTLGMLIFGIMGGSAAL